MYDVTNKDHHEIRYLKHYIAPIMYFIYAVYVLVCTTVSKNKGFNVDGKEDELLQFSPEVIGKCYSVLPCLKQY